MTRDDRLALAYDAGALPLPASGPVAVFRAAPSALYALAGRERFRCVQGERATHDRLAEAGLAVAPDPPDEAAAAVVVATRQRAESLGNLARALAIIPAGAPVSVAGSRTDGIDGLARQIARALPVEAMMTKAHGRVFTVRRPAVLPDAVTAWAEAYLLRPNADGFLTGPGMFSPEHADPGSMRLAAHFDDRLAGRVADLGAGWGWLAARALAAAPGIEAIDLYESEARALEAARRNVTDPRAGFHWSDVTRLPAGPAYDRVIANPPFHQGRAAEPDLGAAFIVAAARILTPGGRLMLVANRTLPYEAPLARSFRSVVTLDEDRSYKVIAAERPVRA